ncbi:MAG: uracil-DNA glycosylase [Burkholderiales bacterium]|nr:uracil-DNA glycosylase [Burkholderiales bacterium]
MTLALDARRRAMLEEMGVVLFEHPAHSGDMHDTPPAPPRRAGGTADLRPARADAAPASAASLLPPDDAATQSAPVAARVRLPGIEAMDWDALEQAVAACRACKLCESRRNTVFGVGDRQAEWLLVGEAPGENEDLQGEPFVGQAGKLLDNMLGALGLNRHERVYIANVLKCRPPGNRNPQPEEIAQCEPFLRRQVELLRPKIILAMGRFAVQTLLQSTEPIGRLRGRVHRYHDVPVVVTYHPAYLLRNLPDKAKAWADLVLAQSVLRGEA